MVQDEMTTEEQWGGFSTGPIIAAALAAGVTAYLIRRSRRQEEMPKTPAGVAAAAWERAQDSDFRRKTAEATRDWLWDRILPDVKPIMLDVLKGVKDLSDQGFKRAEKAIRDL